MTRRILGTALALAILAAFAPPVIAGQLEDAEPEIDFYAMHRTRYEVGDNYFDANDDVNDRYSFWPTRTLVGMKTMLARDIWAQAEIQNFGAWGNQTPQRSATSTTGFPFLQNFDAIFDDQGDHNSDVSLYRAIVGLNNIGGSRLGVAIGRQEYTVGGNLIFGNESFYNGTVFDGLTGWYDWESWKLRGVYFVTEERNDPSDDDFFGGNSGHEDTTVWGFDATIPFGDGDTNNWGDLQVYLYSMDDGQRDPAAKLEEMVYGASWMRNVDSVVDAQANPINWGIEVALQTGEELTNPGVPGDGDTDDFDGWIAEGWFGWNFVSHDRFIHRPAVGFITVAGDDDQTDDDFSGFSPWFGDVHCRLGCADFFTIGFNGFDAGITGTWLGYTFMTNPGRHKAWIKYWNFQPTEDSIDTGGPQNVDIDDYGSEIDIGYAYGYSANAKLYFTYASLSPEEGLVGPNNPDDTIERIYGGVTLSFN